MCKANLIKDGRADKFDQRYLGTPCLVLAELGAVFAWVALVDLPFSTAMGSARMSGCEQAGLTL